MRELILGVDLGATKILTGVMTVSGEIINRQKLPTPVEKGPGFVIDRICSSITNLIEQTCTPDDRLLGMAVATPGPLSFPDATVMDSPNLKWKHVSLGDELAIRLSREVLVEKDTNMAALGEYYFGQQRRYKNLVYVTVSTGIGGGVIIDGHLYRGKGGGASEIGHMVVDPAGRLCSCGRRGCLEAQASGTAIAAIAREALKPPGEGQALPECKVLAETIGALQIGEAARCGDPQAREIVDQVIKYLGIALVNLVNIFDPDVIVLGGGVILGWQDLIMNPLQAIIMEQAFTLNKRNLHLQVTTLGENLVLYGCVISVLNKLHHQYSFREV